MNPGESMANRLKDENSPYLLQHAQNPVDWFPWSEEAFERAREEDKPVFLSIGYAACHWCHVMAHESFEDIETAAVMNEYFINIKVDREERPDIDAIYMGAAVALSGQGGWPLSVFLTPTGKPFHAGTYYPPEPRYGRPSFRDLLLQIARLWQEQRPRLLELSEHLTRSSTASSIMIPSKESLRPETLDLAVKTLFQYYDWKDGGWGQAPKFPQSKAIEFLFRQFSRNKDPLARDMAVHALHKMARGGMHDLIGGGFHRYSVDHQWLVPHFEKMLYDNALLAQAYLFAWQITHEERFHQVALDTLAFLKREMLDPGGGFYSSLDADSEGGEGRYYSWSMEEFQKAIDDPCLFRLAMQVFGITEGGNFEGRNIPFLASDRKSLAKEHDRSPEEIDHLMKDIKFRLLSFREKRPPPALDDKVISCWNGLVLSTFSIAARIGSSREDLRIAQQLADFLLNEMVVDGCLRRSWRQGSSGDRAFLEDHAALALGLFDLYQADFNPYWYEKSVALGDEILRDFSDPQGGFFDTSEEHERLISRPKSMGDNPIPSGNTLAVSLLHKLSALTGEARYAQSAESAVRAMQAQAAKHPTSFAGWLCEIDFALGPQLQLAIIGVPQSDEFQQMTSTTNQLFLPNLVMAGGMPEKDPAPGLLANRTMIEGKCTAYLCQGFTCRLPTVSPHGLLEQLEELHT
jgi:uncharacterized protein YyaL (SSP411 family)